MDRIKVELEAEAWGHVLQGLVGYSVLVDGIPEGGITNEDREIVKAGLANWVVSIFKQLGRTETSLVMFWGLSEKRAFLALKEASLEAGAD